MLSYNREKRTVKRPLIESERLIMRQWHETGHDPYAQLNGHPDVMACLPPFPARKVIPASVTSAHSSSARAGAYGRWSASQVVLSSALQD